MRVMSGEEGVPAEETRVAVSEFKMTKSLLSRASAMEIPLASLRDDHAS